MWLAFLLILLVNVYVFTQTKEPEKVGRVREKYTLLREALVREGLFPELHKPMPLTAYYRTWDGALGYNVNKGFELGVCIDGEVNEVFHVLLHELAHCTVDEFDHSVEYWNNYIELRDVALRLGIYDKIPEKTPFCGKEVQDK